MLFMKWSRWIIWFKNWVLSRLSVEGLVIWHTSIRKNYAWEYLRKIRNNSNVHIQTQCYMILVPDNLSSVYVKRLARWAIIKGPELNQCNKRYGYVLANLSSGCALEIFVSDYKSLCQMLTLGIGLKRHAKKKYRSCISLTEPLQSQRFIFSVLLSCYIG